MMGDADIHVNIPELSPPSPPSYPGLFESNRAMANVPYPQLKMYILQFRLVSTIFVDP